MIDGDTYRIPPQNVDAERAVIGSMIIDNQTIEKVDGLITGQDFYIEAHRKVFNIITRMNKKTVIDIITLSDTLRNLKQLDAIGGESYIARLVDDIPSAANIEHYAQIVKENSLRRQLLSKAYEIIESVHSPEGDVNSCIENSQKLILSVNPGLNSGIIKSAREVALKTFEEIELRSKTEGLVGLSTGLTDLDNITGGLHKGELIIVAGRPSMGKSCLATNIAHAAGKRGEASLIVSIEMPNEALMTRIFASEARIESRQIRKGLIGESGWSKLAAAAGIMNDAKIYFDDSPLITPIELRMRARKAKKDFDIKLLVLDYLQIMCTSVQHKSREQEVADISRTLKSIARELNIPVIGVSQLNRALEQRPNKRPMMSDLRESGAIEQDADVVLFIYRDEVYNKNEDNPNRGIAEIGIGKQRHGATATIKTVFSGKYQQFSDIAHTGRQPNFGYNED
jgi:replicative DNA helicase